MQCDICLRTGGHKLPFLCPTDARNQLYEHRVKHAQVLMEKDALDREISALLKPQNQETEAGQRSRPYVDRITAERDQAEDRTQQIIAHADELRANIKKAREEIAKRKAALNRSRADREEAAKGVEARRSRQSEDIEKNLRIMKYKWNQVHAITASSRAFLCGETAKLYGLRRIRRGSSDEYRIGGVGVVDLLSMNTASPAQISTSLSHIVHLLMLATHYLAIRLPAEITLPHRDYPLPTVFPPAASYKHENVPFPGTLLMPVDQGLDTAAAANGDQQQRQSQQQQEDQPKLPRPRPLFVGKPLPMLAAEDPAAHNLFLEGATLLAYNVAWLCRSQGVLVGDSSTPGGSFEDVCDIGRNMFNLLVASHGRGGPGSVGSGNGSRTPSARTTPTKSGGDDNKERERKGSLTGQTTSSLMGYYSHGTAHSFLGGSAGAEFTRGFKLINPMKLVDKLKSRLASEVANAEWELLDPDAWSTGDGEGNGERHGDGAEGEGDEDTQRQRPTSGLSDGDDGIMVGARRESVDGFGMLGVTPPRRYGYGTQSFMSMRTVMDAVEVIGGVGSGERQPGTSGWTKVKPR